jgi:hypothetical protein
MMLTVMGDGSNSDISQIDSEDNGCDESGMEEDHGDY